MPSWPMVVLAVVFSSLYAAIFHAVRGRALMELPIFVAASLAGFVTGELAARVLNLNVLMIGELHIVEATIGSLAFLFIARWLKV
jgi:hypothetical protein